MTGHITITDNDAVRVITLQRPEKKNAITHDMYRTMSGAIDSAQTDPIIRCIVITGSSGVFTAGNDLDDFLKDGTSGGVDSMPHTSDAAVKFLYALVQNTKPLIAAVEGIAIGIGTTMLFHCDYVLAGNSATFSTPFIHLGLVPEGASSLLAPQSIGYQRAFAMLVMGRTLSASEARDAGFVNAVVTSGEAAAESEKIAREICALPAEAVALSRKLLKPPTEELTRRIDLESRLFAERLRSDEAIAAFQTFFARKKR
jgi:enoyl-CoA hydratase/carnithine racemase